jgi:hypothetical protein
LEFFFKRIVPSDRVKKFNEGLFQETEKTKIFFLFLGKNLLIEELMPSVRIGKRDFCC